MIFNVNCNLWEQPRYVIICENNLLKHFDKAVHREFPLYQHAWKCDNSCCNYLNLGEDSSVQNRIKEPVLKGGSWKWLLYVDVDVDVNVGGWETQSYLKMSKTACEKCSHKSRLVLWKLHIIVMKQTIHCTNVVIVSPGLFAIAVRSSLHWYFR